MNNLLATAILDIEPRLRTVVRPPGLRPRCGGFGRDVGIQSIAELRQESLTHVIA